MWESESEAYGGSGGGRDYGGSVSVAHDGVQTDGFIRRDHSWHVSSDVPSDLLVRIGDSNFHLHKYPLLSRSGKMNRLIYETSREAELDGVELNDIPGGTESFELAAKFCYGIAVDLTASNISGLRCAAEYLEMTEDLEEGNLIFKTEAFLSYVVLASWRDSIVVLKSCEGLSPWAENLQIVRRCSESIAWKACANPRGIRWPYTGKSTRTDSPRWGTAAGDSKGSSPGAGGSSQLQPPPADWWFEDVSLLRIDHLVRVITAIKVKGMRFDLIGASIIHYASKWLPSLPASDVPPSPDTRDHRTIIESLISILPPQKDAVPCAFLLRLLRLASVAKVAAALATDLEKRVGMQLEQASVSDLLIPAGGGSTMYDVDLVQRLVEHFIVQEQVEAESAEKVGNAKARVARLVDGYLTEVSRDRNLSLTKFQVLAEALPESARMCDDGLYRAVDSYLKAHPMLTEHERKRLCRVMDCQKLSIDACMHAAQNERLPLRVVVQVLFSEQIKINNAIANSTAKESHNGHGHFYPPIVTRKQLLEGTPQSFQEGWATAKKDINSLKFELESMKAKYLELQNDMDSLQRQFDKLSTSSAPKTAKSASSGWGSGWKKLGKLAKMSVVEGHDVGGGEHVEQARKGPRRWRNSIS